MKQRAYIPLVFAAALSLGITTTSAFAQEAVTFEDAISAFNYGDNDLANKHFWKLAGQGDARAQYYLAYMLDAGLGTGQDMNGAANWYKKSAEQDFLPAVVYMGYIYSQGRGVAKDEKEAFKWYTRAAQMGDAVAQNNLATMLLVGKPYTKNAPLAAQWFLQSAMQGNMRAQYNLATMYRTGDGVGRNYKEALKWYGFAANQGDMYAQNALGYMYRKGLGTERLPADATEEQKAALDLANKQQAIEWYRRAAEQGHMKSQMALAVMYELGEAGSERGPDEAAVWYFSAARQGNERAMHRLGYFYERGPEACPTDKTCERPEREGRGLPKDDKEALKWYRKAAEEKNYTPSIIALARFYQNGLGGLRKDPKKALDLFNKAAGRSDPVGMLELARIYREGSGVPKDNVRALQWYGLAYQTLQEQGKNPKGPLPDPDLETEATKWRIYLRNNMSKNDIENATRLINQWRPTYVSDPGSQPLFYDK
ncbi:MAG: SEL1-like repeat protein [Alphaproteobacteria bacterium]|nr:SEL1-like repeat protein [Alphaproteobacteria bacterium]